MHVVFEEVRTTASFGLDLDLPVWSTFKPAAAGLVLAALVAVFHFRFGAVAVLTTCAAGGLVLSLAGMV